MARNKRLKSNGSKQTPFPQGGVDDSVAQRAGAEAVSVANGVLAQMELLLAETGLDRR